MHHFVYKTTNLVNGKIYIGKHSTYNLDDTYLGSGSAIVAAINKHGIHNFKREILMLCNTEEEAIALERSLVTREFCARDDTYNINAANQGHTWTGVKRPEQVGVMLRAKPWEKVKRRSGGKAGPGKKRVMARRGSEVVLKESIKAMAKFLGVARRYVRSYCNGMSTNRDGWEVTFA